MSPKNRNTLIVLGLSLAIIFGVGFGYWKYFGETARQEIAALETDTKNMEKRLEEAKIRAQQLSKIEEEMHGLQIEVAAMERQLPKDRELPNLIRVFSNRAEAFGLTINSFAPDTMSAKGLYDEIPYKVSVSASFHGIGQFLTAMGKGERLFAARDISFQGAPNRSDPTKTVTATFTLVAFKYHE